MRQSRLLFLVKSISYDENRKIVGAILKNRRSILIFNVDLEIWERLTKAKVKSLALHKLMRSGEHPVNFV